MSMKIFIRDLPLLLFAVFVFSFMGWLALNAVTVLEGKSARWDVEQIEMVRMEAK